MDISSLSSSSLRNIIGLVEKREKLAVELSKVDASINDILSKGGKIVLPSPAKKKVSLPKAASSSKPVGRRGALKEKILAELKAAGKGGVTVQELSAKLGAKPQNIYVWFATTGKSVGTKKIGRGKFSL